MKQDNLNPHKFRLASGTKFKYTDFHDVFLLKEVQEYNAHTAPFGQITVCFTQIMQYLNTSKKFKNKESTWKIVQERYNALKRAFREKTNVEKRISGGCLTLNEKDSILENLIAKEAEFVLQKAAAKKQERERALAKRRFRNKVIDLCKKRTRGREDRLASSVSVKSQHESIVAKSTKQPTSSLDDNALKKRKGSNIACLYDENLNEINRTLAEGGRNMREIQEREISLTERRFQAE